MAEAPQIVLFDIDGTLIESGGAGRRAWRWAFNELYGIPADIGEFTDAGMTDPEVGRLTFERVIGHEPSGHELARLLHAYLAVISDMVANSPGYRVLEGVSDLLPRLCEAGMLLGLTTGALEASAHVKLGRGELNHFFAFGGYGSDSADRVELTLRALHRGECILGKEVDPRRVYVVGDTPRDVEAARSAGLVGIGVGSGAYTREQLGEAGAEIALGSLAEPFPGLTQAVEG